MITPSEFELLGTAYAHFHGHIGRIAEREHVTHEEVKAEFCRIIRQKDAERKRLEVAESR